VLRVQTIRPVGPSIFEPKPFLGEDQWFLSLSTSQPYHPPTALQRPALALNDRPPPRPRVPAGVAEHCSKQADITLPRQRSRQYREAVLPWRIKRACRPHSFLSDGYRNSLISFSTWSPSTTGLSAAICGRVTCEDERCPVAAMKVRESVGRSRPERPPPFRVRTISICDLQAQHLSLRSAIVLGV
jgi:hypothetical protein